MIVNGLSFPAGVWFCLNCQDCWNPVLLLKPDGLHCTAGCKTALLETNSNKMFFLSWSNFNFSDSGKMEVLIWPRWFCSVGSSCIIETVYWSHPWHRVVKWIFWKFEVCAFMICKVILKFSPSLRCSSDSAGNEQYITGLLIYYLEMNCYDDSL